MKRKRTVVHVVFDAENAMWIGLVGKSVIQADRARCMVLALLRADMKEMQKRGYKGQIVVHRKDGRIAFENTYGDDPKGRG